ncbi:hypothetical protein [Apilactobacillus timberlakei]|uniref:hypothetical protein n=1 Tax=Apilactobacillus timberlakei TaxID=2008380 RepID=UPI0015E872A3|nr:hypothetical protein [Apilactobacillus timberlakei]
MLTLDLVSVSFGAIIGLLIGFKCKPEIRLLNKLIKKEFLNNVQSFKKSIQDK